MAASWVKRFAKDSITATVDILNLTLCCSGAATNVLKSGEVLSQMDTDELNDLMNSRVRDLLEPKANNSKYPLIDTTKASKRLVKSMHEWWRRVVEATQTGNSYQYGPLHNVINELTVLSSANIRSVRHTASAACWGVAGALVDGQSDLSAKIETTQRQLKSEAAKADKSKKARQLKDRVASLEDSAKMLDELLLAVFNGVFVHRYRDRDSKLRDEAISALGKWIVGYPQKLLDDKFLKYFGWLLHDKDPAVRSAVITSLTDIFSLEASTEGLLLFCTRFNKRLLDMAHDVDEEVAIATFKLLCELLVAGVLDHEDIAMTDEEFTVLDGLVFHRGRSNELRLHAMKFALSHFDHFDDEADEDNNVDEDDDEKPKGSAREVEKRAARQLDELLDFCDATISTGDPSDLEDADLLVDAMVQLPQVQQ